VCVPLLGGQVACLNGADMSDLFLLTGGASGAAIGSDARIYIAPGAAGNDVSVYSASGAPLTGFISPTGGAGLRGLVVSSDGFILGMASGPYDPGRLVIAPIGP
jgi:hypothetical protein